MFNHPDQLMTLATGHMHVLKVEQQQCKPSNNATWTNYRKVY